MSRAWHYLVIGILIALFIVGMLITFRTDAAPAAGGIREFLGVDLAGAEAAAVAVLTKRYGAPKSVEKTPISTFYGWTGQAIGCDAGIVLQAHAGRVCNVAVVCMESSATYAARYIGFYRLLQSKYGVPYATRSYQYPYEDGDGYEASALALGKATIADTWGRGGDFEIILRVSNKFVVSVNYFNNDVYKRLEAARTARDSGNL